MRNSEPASASIPRAVHGWQGYLDAKLGFKNHWYPVCRTADLQEKKPYAVKALGESLLLNRIDGKPFAIRNRCLHRGAPFSKRLECHTPGTVSCWYHGWTYRWDTGELVQILSDPGSRQIGRQFLRTFPAEEAAGLVFVFIGDRDRTPHDLRLDLPPGLLDEGRCGGTKIRLVRSNWRVAVENGFDGGHIYIHRHSVLIKGADIQFPIGIIYRPSNKDKVVRIVEADGGPIGVYDVQGYGEPVFEGIVEGRVVVEGNKAGEHQVGTEISAWLPCSLKVDPFPQPGYVVYEWYVPADEDTHLYVQHLTKICPTEAERQEFEHLFETRWRDMLMHGFNDDDVFAREAVQPFYADDAGWTNEVLYEADLPILEWRRLASRRNCGIQTKADTYK